MTSEPVTGAEPGRDADASLPAMAALRCRDDILQAMYWLRGEGFGTETDAQSLARFLTTDASLVGQQLAGLVSDGYLERAVEGFRLSPLGVREGGRRFADEFADLQLTAHGECAPDCPHCEGVARDECIHCGTSRDAEAAWSW